MTECFVYSTVKTFQQSGVEANVLIINVTTSMTIYHNSSYVTAEQIRRGLIAKYTVCMYVKINTHGKSDYFHRNQTDGPYYFLTNVKSLVSIDQVHNPKTDQIQDIYLQQGSREELSYIRHRPALTTIGIEYEYHEAQKVTCADYPLEQTLQGGPKVNSTLRINKFESFLLSFLRH